MTNNNLLNGLRKKDTYNSLVGYLDGGQERMMYPDRLATQLKNSHQMSNLVDMEGKSWFEENKAQMRRFTEQQVHEVVVKENLEEGQTFQEQKILQQRRPSQPRETQRGEGGIEQPPDNPDFTDTLVSDMGIQQRKPKQQSTTQAPLNSERGIVSKEDGVVELFKKEMRNKIAQEAATYVMKKALEKLPGLIARAV